jgi:hypothetical protein
MSKIFFLLLFIFPLQVSAHLYKFEYSGTITTLYGTGLGYSIGESVSGALTLDLSKAIDTTPEMETAATFKSPTGENFVSGFHSQNEPLSADIFIVQNGAHYDSNSVDAIHIGDWVPLGDRYSRFMFDLILILNPATFSNKYPDDINFSTANMKSDGTWGNIQRTRYEIGSDGIGAMFNDQAIFNIEYITASKVAEPFSLTLMLLGSMAVFLLRALKQRS